MFNNHDNFACDALTHWLVDVANEELRRKYIQPLRILLVVRMSRKNGYNKFNSVVGSVCCHRLEGVLEMITKQEERRLSGMVFSMHISLLKIFQN